MLVDVLENLGLSSKAGEIYLASLQLGPTTIQTLAEKANTPRSSTYLLIHELKGKGLISETKVGKKTIFTATGPERVLEMAKAGEESANRLYRIVEGAMPEMTAMQKRRTGRPSVRFYEGFEGVKTILEETIGSREILVICSGYEEPLEKRLADYLERYFKEIIKKGIKTFEIIGGSPDAEVYKKRYSSEKNQIKIAGRGKNIEHIDKLIFEDKVAIISFAYLNGVILENLQIANFERELFWRTWK